MLPPLPTQRCRTTPKKARADTVPPLTIGRTAAQHVEGTLGRGVDRTADRLGGLREQSGWPQANLEPSNFSR